MVDVFIIGGGPGGYVAAIKAAQLGLSVALAEEADMGGTCTNWGCIPTKTMLASSKLLTRMQEARKFGLTAEGVGADFGAIMTRKDQVVVRLRKGIEYLMKKNNVQVYAGGRPCTMRHTSVSARPARSSKRRTSSSPPAAHPSSSLPSPIPASGPVTMSSATGNSRRSSSSSGVASSASRWPHSSAPSGRRSRSSS